MSRRRPNARTRTPSASAARFADRRSPRAVLAVLAGVVVVAVTGGWLLAHRAPAPGSGTSFGGGGATAAPTSSAPVSSAPATSAASATGVRAAPDEVEELHVQVMGTRGIRPHDRSAFTQGLVWYDGHLYESTGLYGESSLREVDPVSGEVRRWTDVAPEYFAEGLALVGERLIQLTWKEQVAFVYDRATFAELKRFDYRGEGWGLCYDGERLAMSDGSSSLFFRDPTTFEVTGSVEVTRDGQPVTNLNELECVGGLVYANVWQTSLILVIDPSTGAVRGVADAAGLLAPEDHLPPAGIPAPDVLNGIAYDPLRETFLITGKRWPKLFEVRFVSDERTSYLPEIVKNL